MAKSHKRPQKRSKRQSQNQNQQNQNQLNSLFGGEGAAPYVAAVAGSPSEQHAGSNGNTIALTPMSGGSGLSILAPSSIGSGGNLISGGSSYPGMNGGKRKVKGKGKKGGNLLQQLAVPAVFLYANNTFGRRGKSYARKTRKFRGSRRFRK
jgi:hypothetical protein